MRSTAAALAATVFVAAASATIPSVVQRASVNWTDADWPAELGSNALRSAASIRGGVASGNVGGAIPKVIYMLWIQGWEHAPPWNKICRQTWELLNPEYTLHALDLEGAERLGNRQAWVSDAAFNMMEMPSKSDVLRVLILAAHGGIWVDASVACNIPLSFHLDSGWDVVTFRRDDADSKKKVRTHADGMPRKMIDPWITSWFMAAPINSYFITRLRDATATFWANYVLLSQYSLVKGQGCVLPSQIIPEETSADSCAGKCTEKGESCAAFSFDPEGSRCLIFPEAKCKMRRKSNFKSWTSGIKDTSLSGKTPGQGRHPTRHKQYLYFWLHMEVANLVHSDPKFALALDSTRLRSADGMHCYGSNTTFNHGNDRRQYKVAMLKSEPMFKRCMMNEVKKALDKRIKMDDATGPLLQPPKPGQLEKLEKAYRLSMLNERRTPSSTQERSLIYMKKTVPTPTLLNSSTLLAQASNADSTMSRVDAPFQLQHHRNSVRSTPFGGVTTVAVAATAAAAVGFYLCF